MTLSDLLQLAKLCDKYDTVSVLRPFLRKWVDPLEKYYDVSFREEWLFIAWTFGYQTMFGSTLSTLIREVAVCRDSGSLKWEGRNISHSLPPGIQEAILQRRDETISKLLHVCLKYYNGMISA
ncbi:hypothetical protein LTS18_002492, partial [Coniosporium uncinatum]